jgi:hypothetical protein
MFKQKSKSQKILTNFFVRRSRDTIYHIIVSHENDSLCVVRKNKKIGAKKDFA